MVLYQKREINAIFEGFRRDLKRCIAHPGIKYYNAMYTSSGDQGPNQAKLESGMDSYLVDTDTNTKDKLGEIYGYMLQKCCSCCICYVRLGGVAEEYWVVQDESDEWTEEKELELKRLEEKKEKTRERQKQKKSGKAKGKRQRNNKQQHENERKETKIDDIVE